MGQQYVSGYVRTKSRCTTQTDHVATQAAPQQLPPQSQNFSTALNQPTTNQPTLPPTHHAPPVRSRDGSSSASMYTFLDGLFTFFTLFTSRRPSNVFRTWGCSTSGRSDRCGTLVCQADAAT